MGRFPPYLAEAPLKTLGPLKDSLLSDMENLPSFLLPPESLFLLNPTDSASGSLMTSPWDEAFDNESCLPSHGAKDTCLHQP